LMPEWLGTGKNGEESIYDQMRYYLGIWWLKGQKLQRSTVQITSVRAEAWKSPLEYSRDHCCCTSLLSTGKYWTSCQHSIYTQRALNDSVLYNSDIRFSWWWLWRNL
jgi:hypothetical protein